MDRYDKTVIQQRLRARRWARQGAGTAKYNKALNVVIGLLALGALALLAMMLIGFLG